MFHLVLLAPEIPHNAGAAGRLCLATGSTLHLIKPLGFSIDDKHVRRAGLDYWEDVDVHVWDDLPALQAAHPDGRFWFLSTKGDQSPWDTRFAPGDFFVLGSEARGLPESLLAAHPDRVLRIPMRESSTRSLNLATSAAIILYEAWRQNR
jgi:tRNA (cytidine/uridine-2'-O-)-methyltransferase